MYEYGFRRRYRGTLKAVILDWAGTTVDYGCCAPAAAFIEVFKKQGVTITVEEARAPMGTYKKDHIRIITKMPEVAKRWKTVHDRLPGEEDVETMFREFIPLQVECITRHADLIPGCLDTIEILRARGLKIGSNTGYTREMLEVLSEAARKQGFDPESQVCASDVPKGRPAPWMSLENMRQLDVYPVETLVKIDDTVVGIEEGLNAGMWTIGIALSGNEMGMTEAEVAILPEEERSRRLEAAYDKLYRGGSHYVVDTIADILLCIEDMERKLSDGRKP